MTVDELIAQTEDKSPLGSEDELLKFEANIGQQLPEDYRSFLIKCNGGYLASNGYGIGGLRPEPDFSLVEGWNRYVDRIPSPLMWIMSDPFGNAICLGIEGEHVGKVYFWDHENEPLEDEWDGEVETASNVTLVANSFTEYIAGLQNEDD